MNQVIVFIDGKITRLYNIEHVTRVGGIIEFTDSDGNTVAEFAENAISGWKASTK